MHAVDSQPQPLLGCVPASGGQMCVPFSPSCGTLFQSASKLSRCREQINLAGLGDTSCCSLLFCPVEERCLRWPFPGETVRTISWSRRGMRVGPAARRHRGDGQSWQPLRVPPSATRSEQPAQSCSSCRPTVRISIRLRRCFAKLKTLLRKAAARSVEATWRRIGQLLAQFAPDECANYFIDAGYAST